MTDHVVRLYALAIAVLGFFVAWALVAAHPWQGSAPASVSPAERRLALYEQRLVRAAALADALARQRAERAAGGVAAASAAEVLPPRIVTLPAVTETRTS